MKNHLIKAGSDHKKFGPESKLIPSQWSHKSPNNQHAYAEVRFIQTALQQIRFSWTRITKWLYFITKQRNIVSSVWWLFIAVKSTTPDKYQGLTQPSGHVNRLTKWFGLRGLNSFVFDLTKLTLQQGLNNRLRVPPATDCPDPSNYWRIYP